MTLASSVVKQTAKATIKGRWVKSITVSAMFLFIVFICSNSAMILSQALGDIVGDILYYILGIFIVCPAFLGVLRFFWRMHFEADDSPILIFFYFSDIKTYKRAMTLIFSLVFRIVLFGLLLNIPAFATQVMSHSFVYELIGLSIPVWTANLTTVVLILEIIAKVILSLIMLKYYLAPMLFVANDSIDVEEAILMSSVISRKTSIDFIYLIFSFFGWFLLSLFVVPLIFTIPFFIVSYLVHSKFCILEYNQHIEKISENTFPSFTV